MTPEERRHVPGLQPKRSEIILAGLIIAKSFLKRYEIPAVMASERDIMEGISFAIPSTMRPGIRRKAGYESCRGRCRLCSAARLMAAR